MTTNSASYNPDVLSCLANLSNDEVFTPPDVVNDMLDMLPDSLWKNPSATFLDPCCKTGVFLREIAKRLNTGLASLPEYAGDQNLQKRLDHIFKKQLYGIAITELTSLLSRRSVYCSKTANGKYSVTTFDSENGHIYFSDCAHTWQNGKCTFCGASESEYGSRENLESHAYQFIHNATPEEINNMKFDVIIGNPPYQLTTAGEDNGAQAKPIYQNFVEEAIKLQPKYIVMITPSRWFSGGWGLDDFRSSMLNSDHIRILHDFQNSSDCFTGVEIKGGISYFLFDNNYKGVCTFYSHEQNKIKSVSNRFLHEKDCDVLIRYNELIPIYRKVSTHNKFKSFETIVSGRSPFGLNTNHYGSKQQENGTIPYFERNGFTYIEKNKISKNQEWISKYKLFIAKTAEDGKLPGKVIGKITRGPIGTVCSGTYLTVGPFINEKQMINTEKYMQTKFFRILVSINKISQDAYAKVYSSVPMQDFSDKSDIDWSQSVSNIDKQLFKKYNLTQEEISFIESMIRPMDSSSEGSENE